VLRQDIANLTIHLRTKKEMSKVAAHYELVSDIIALRDDIAPHTLLTINGDIENRAAGLDLVQKYPGIDGIMIGRGVFHDPFCFEASASASTNTENTTSMPIAASDETRLRLISLLHYHLDLYDTYQPQLSRPFETLKRFFKVYIRDFNGASELRHQLMQTKNTTEVRNILDSQK